MVIDPYGHPPCCGPGCEGVFCWDCRGTGHPHPPDGALEHEAIPVPGDWQPS